MEKMRSTPINDFFVKGGKIREDGRMVHEVYLYEVKKPAESRGGMGLLQACRHDSGGPGISAVIRIQMPAGEKGAVGVVEGYDLQSHCAAHDALQKWDRTSSVVLTLGGCPLGEFCCMIFHGFAAWRSEPSAFWSRRGCARFCWADLPGLG